MFGNLIAIADSTVISYEFKELAMILDIPTEISAFTRGIKASDAMADFRENNLYLIAKNKDSTL